MLRFFLHILYWVFVSFTLLLCFSFDVLKHWPKTTRREKTHISAHTFKEQNSSRNCREMQLAGWLFSFSSPILLGARTLCLGMEGYLYQLANKKMSQLVSKGQSDWDNPRVETLADNLKLCQTDTCS